MATSVKTVSETRIPLCVPSLGGNEAAYVKDCVDTGWVSSVGAYVDRFEQAIAAEVGTRFAVATTSGTAALHTAMLVAGIKPADEVLVSTLTFIAPVNAIRYVGAHPVIVDAEPDYWQMDVGRVIEFLEKGCTWREGKLTNRLTGRQVRAILPVHILGHPVDLQPLLEIARKFDLLVIEDASESLGASYRGRRVGSFGDLACFSFNGNKLITTGGGGMLVTDNPVWAERARYLTTQAKDDPIEYVHNHIGYNYRLTNIQAALGLGQVEQLMTYLKAKKATARHYSDVLAGLSGITVPSEAAWACSAWWMYTVLVDKSASGSDSRALLTFLESKAIQTRPLWQPMHLSPAHRECFAIGGEVAERLYAQALSLPCSVGVTREEQDRVCEQIELFFQS